MILDERNEFADAVSVAGTAGTALIGDVIDLTATHRGIGNGQPLYLVITTDTEIITGGSAMPMSCMRSHASSCSTNAGCMC